MFVHLGENVAVRSDQIVAIIDLEMVNDSLINRLYLQRCQEANMVEDVSNGVPHSVVITGQKTYLSPISPLTLKKRAENLWNSKSRG